jgi:hypothetical protein
MEERYLTCIAQFRMVTFLINEEADITSLTSLFWIQHERLSGSRKLT